MYLFAFPQGQMLLSFLHSLLAICIEEISVQIIYSLFIWVSCSFVRI